MKRAAALVGLVPVLMVGLGGTAYADAPTKTGWWNAASANGVALPMPTTSPDNLHVGQGANGPTAYAAVAYSVTQQISGATLQLKVAPNSTVGTIDVVACPTRSLAWKAGGNQAIDSAPDYDCTHGVQGVVAADGSTVTFLLDAAQLVEGTGFSVAIAPSADAKPFDADFVKPDATSLTPQLDAGYTEPAAAAAPPPAPAPQPPTTAVSGSAPLAAGSIAQPPVQAPAMPAPAVAAPLSPQPAPAVAPMPVTQAAAARPVAPVSNRERYAAGSGLALLAGFLVWAFQQSNPEPRLIGGMARKAGVPVAPVDPTPRGIGRFATVRTAPARRLV